MESGDFSNYIYLVYVANGQCSYPLLHHLLISQICFRSALQSKTR